MRSTQSHNTFYSNANEHQNLFILDKHVRDDTSYKEETANHIFVLNYRTSSSNLHAHRELMFEKKELSLELIDYWSENSNGLSHWNLIFHPNIKISKTRNVWKISYNNIALATLETSLDFTQENGFYSSGYGIIEKTTKLYTQKPITKQKETIKFIGSKH